MIRVRVYTDAAGRIRRFAAEGHSGFAPHGQDIVCAAVSVLLQTAVLGLQDLTQAAPEIVIEDGSLDCLVATDGPDSGKVDTILQTMLLGLQAIEAEYPGFVSLSEIRI